MTARELISPTRSLVDNRPQKVVDASLHILDVIPRLLDSPGRSLDVTDENGASLGVIDQVSLLEGIGRLIAARDDSSVVVVECNSQDYSASLIAGAVEDADAHLVDMITSPAADGKIRVTLRVRISDPVTVVHSLERYNFDIVAVHSGAYTDAAIASERMAALQLYLNV